MASPNSDYDHALPRKRVAAGVLFFDDQDRTMLVDPIYKDPWDIPGGAVDADESPRAGAHREIKEELGLDLPPGRLLAVDWTAPRPDRSEGIVFIYDGGHLTAEQLATIQLQSEELRAYEPRLPRPADPARPVPPGGGACAPEAHRAARELPPGPYVDEAEHTHGVYRFQLRCSGWHARGTWTKEITASEVTALVRAFVDTVLAAPQSSPGAASGTR